MDQTATTQGGKVLVLDDDASMTELVARTLTKRGFATVGVTTRDAALDALDRQPFDAVLTDLQLGEVDGLEFCQSVLSRHGDLPVIVFTAFGSLEAAIGAIRAGAYDFVTKPVDMETLIHSVARAVDFSHLQREVNRLRQAATPPQALGEMIGDSRAMRRVAELVSRVAKSDANVLITGESGTGKELVARAIHDLSGRTGPFVPINCAAVPETLLESELFGHTRGAFTDAKTSKLGLFAEAQHGSVFLDEIGELPLLMQPKLLRALQERKVRPVGGSGELEFDARVITATNKNLEEAVAEGNFREDLYYRVNVVVVELPPLRQRGSDVLALAQYFIERATARSGKEVVGLSPEAADKLMQYSFPGNVRELENAMERAVALARYDRITVEDLPARIKEFKSSEVFIAAEDPAAMVTMDELEQRYMRKVLDATKSNKSRAARILGFDRRTLYRKMERYGIPL